MGLRRPPKQADQVRRVPNLVGPAAGTVATDLVASLDKALVGLAAFGLIVGARRRGEEQFVASQPDRVLASSDGAKCLAIGGSGELEQLVVGQVAQSPMAPVPIDPTPVARSRRHTSCDLG